MIERIKQLRAERGISLIEAANIARAEAGLPPINRPDAPPWFDFRGHLQRQREFSERTFGPGARTRGVVEHIRQELDEILADPTDVEEWIDVVILALDGAWRAGGTPDSIIATLRDKQQRNENRQWPDWRGRSEDEPINHVRATPGLSGGVQAATPGPWTVEAETDGPEVGYEATVFYRPEGSRRDYAIMGCPDCGTGGYGKAADAELIAHAPSDLAALLARVKELEAEAAARQPVVDAALSWHWTEWEGNVTPDRTRFTASHLARVVDAYRWAVGLSGVSQAKS